MCVFAFLLRISILFSFIQSFMHSCRVRMTSTFMCIMFLTSFGLKSYSEALLLVPRHISFPAIPFIAETLLTSDFKSHLMDFTLSTRYWHLRKSNTFRYFDAELFDWK